MKSKSKNENENLVDTGINLLEVMPGRAISGLSHPRIVQDHETTSGIDLSFR